MQIQLPLFIQDKANNPTKMAEAYDIPYLGKLPMDPNIMKSCEDGSSFIENYPTSTAVVPLNAIIDQIMNSC